MNGHETETPHPEGGLHGAERPCGRVDFVDAHMDGIQLGRNRRAQLILRGLYHIGRRLRSDEF